MEDRKTALAILICIMFTICYMETFINPYTQSRVPPPSPTSVATSVPLQPASVITGPQNVVPGGPAVTPPVAVASHPTLAQLTEYGSTTVHTGKATISITHLGGRLSEVKLKAHRLAANDEHPLDLVSRFENVSLPLGVYSGAGNDEMVLYALSEVSPGAATIEGGFSVAPSNELTLSFTGQFPSGSKIIKRFRFRRDSQLIDISVALDSAPSDGSRLWLEWSHFASESDVNAKVHPKRYIILGADNEYKRVALPEIKDGVPEFGSNVWSTLGDEYFVAALVPTEINNNTKLGRLRVGVNGYQYVTQVSGGVQSGEFHLFVGAKEFAELKMAGHELHRVRDLGIFSFIADPLLSLMRVFNTFLSNWGLSIILLTLVIKTAFLPLTRASFKSMGKMQELQPEIKELRERIKDPTELNREMMELYKRRGVNPMGGCLPVLIQIPVFLGLYNALLNSIELRHAPFALWISDLSAPEKPLPVMVVLMGLSMLVQQWMTPSAMDPVQKKVMLIMPVVFTLMFIYAEFPSGLVLYWFVNNIISIIQQWYIKGERSTTPLRATILGSLFIFCFGFVLTRL